MLCCFSKEVEFQLSKHDWRPDRSFRIVATVFGQREAFFALQLGGLRT